MCAYGTDGQRQRQCHGRQRGVAWTSSVDQDREPFLAEKIQKSTGHYGHGDGRNV